jgi:hypothetical protein
MAVSVNESGMAQPNPSLGGRNEPSNGVRASFSRTSTRDKE